MRMSSTSKFATVYAYFAAFSLWAGVANQAESLLVHTIIIAVIGLVSVTKIWEKI
jgi:hypothetical protein